MSKNDEYTMDLAILLLRKMADKMEAEPDFAEQLLNEVKALRKKKDQELKKKIKSVGSGSEPPQAPPKAIPGNKKPASQQETNKALSELPDIYAVYMRGQEDGMRSCLEGYELEDLRRIVAQNRLDPSGKVRKWKRKPMVVEFIIETTQKRLSQGEAFKSE